jgi:ribose 1,5-bisphosphokinase PhnN
MEAVEHLQPGEELGRQLERIDRSTLDDDGLVTLLRARARQIAHLQAEFYTDMVAVARACERVAGPDGFEFAADEIAAALTWTRRAASTHLSLALDLTEHLPEVGVALSEGAIDLPRARVIVDGLSGIELDVAVSVTQRALASAGSETTGQIGARLRRLVIHAGPDAARSRYRRGLDDRRVELGANPDGTATLTGCHLPSDRAAAALDRIHHLARHATTTGDPRTADQVRADVLMDLLEGRYPSSAPRRGHVDIRVDLTTLARLDDRPAEIPGWGPVIADVARRVALDQAHDPWTVTVVDGGEVVHTGPIRRRPDSYQRRRSLARTPTCVFPGCRMPARRSDLDHTQPYARGGPTIPGNLGPLCRHHHRLKHRAGWHLDQPHPGVFHWTSVLGREYEVTPEPP